MKVIILCIVCSVIGNQRDDTGANNKCHRKCTLSQPTWVTSFVLSFCCDERNLGLGSCSRSLTLPRWAADSGILPWLWPVNPLYLRFSWGEASPVRSCGLSSTSLLSTDTYFSNWVFSQCKVLGQWVTPLDTKEGRGERVFWRDHILGMWLEKPPEGGSCWTEKRAF